MESLHLNLPILLWALSWNNSYPDLVSNDKARFARMALTTSELLPRILKIWHHPPRIHNHGVRTEAARRAMEDWALDTVCDILDKESDNLEEYLKFPLITQAPGIRDKLGKGAGYELGRSRE